MSSARAVALTGRATRHAVSLLTRKTLGGCLEAETRKGVMEWVKGSKIVGGSLRLKASVTDRRCRYCLFDYALAFAIKLRKIQENLSGYKVGDKC